MTTPTWSITTAGASTVACASEALTAINPPPLTDNLPIIIAVGAATAAYDTACGGTIIYTYTYTGCDNTTKTWTYTYTITPPTWSVPTAGASTVACASEALTAPAAPEVRDNCGRIIAVGAATAAYDTACGGTIIYTYTYTGCDNTTKTWTYTYTITPPTWSVPTAGASTVACASEALTAPAAPEVRDNCGRIIAVGAATAAYDTACGGTIIYTYTYTGCDNTTKTWTYTYTITPPTWSGPTAGASTVACASEGLTAPAAPEVRDNCGRIIAVGAATAAYDTACGGTIIYTYTYTGCDNTTKTWTYTYTITPPTWSVPTAGASTVACASEALTAPAAPEVRDNCGRIIAVGAATAAYDTACGGTIIYTYTYTGCDNTTKTWTYTYTITPPTWSGPTAGASTVACASEGLTAPAAPEVRDNCGRIIAVGAATAAYDTACGGTIIYTYTYTGCDNTTKTWTYTYTITPPTWSVPTAGASTVACASEALTAPAAPEVRDNCGRIIAVGAATAAYDTACGGTIIYTYTYTGCDNTTKTWTYTYTITPPTWSGPTAGASTVACASEGLTAPAAPEVRDNCGRIIAVGAATAAYDTACGGTIIYTYTYTGCDNTTKTWTYTYTITPPTWSVPTAGASTVACASEALTAPAAPEVRDNCGRIIAVGAATAAYDTACGGTIIYTYTYTGCDNTTKTWTYTYTITPPTWSGPTAGASTVACASEGLTAPAAPEVRDNCGRIIAVGAATAAYDTACGGTIIYTYTYTGCDNTTKTWTYTYTITPPTWSVPTAGASTVACASEALTAPAVLKVTDNSERNIAAREATVAYDTACGGTIIYTYTYT